MILAILPYMYFWGGWSSTSTAPDSEFCPHGYGQKKTKHKWKGTWTLASQKKRIQTSTLTTQDILSSLILHPVSPLLRYCPARYTEVTGGTGRVQRWCQSTVPWVEYLGPGHRRNVLTEEVQHRRVAHGLPVLSSLAAGPRPTTTTQRDPCACCSPGKERPNSPIPTPPGPFRSFLFSLFSQRAHDALDPANSWCVLYNPYPSPR
jgi:hypothetical protein